MISKIYVAGLCLQKRGPRTMGMAGAPAYPVLCLLSSVVNA